MSKQHTHHKHTVAGQAANTAQSTAASAPPPTTARQRDVPVAAPVNLSVTPERIRARAYELYQARTASGIYGSATDDWLASERELIASSPDSTIAQEIELKASSRSTQHSA